MGRPGKVRKEGAMQKVVLEREGTKTQLGSEYQPGRMGLR